MKRPTEELVPEFHQAFGLPAPKHVTVPSRDLTALRLRLIEEEFEEVTEELRAIINEYRKPSPSYGAVYETLLRLAKELADLRYVTEGAAVVMGIPFERVYREVHRSNMSKLGPDGKPLRRPDGKVLKGPNYTEADIEGIVGAIIEGEVV